MSTGILVTEESILTRVTEKSFERGEDYYDSGMVESVVQRGSRLFAEVLGSEEDPYDVGIAFQHDDFTAFCTCPYDWGGYCKHIVAVLLTWIRDRELITVRQPIEDLLSDMNADSLKALVLHLVEMEPGLSETVDHYCRDLVSAN